MTILASLQDLLALNLFYKPSLSFINPAKTRIKTKLHGVQDEGVYLTVD